MNQFKKLEKSMVVSLIKYKQNLSMEMIRMCK